MDMRLDKAVALAGLSRSEARKAIQGGRVLVDGAPVRDPAMQVEPGRVRLDGGGVIEAGELILMVNKPAGVLTATEDRRFETVLDLLPEPMRRRGLGPVGRLDKDVTGLVLLTTDGQLAHRLIAPKWKAEKVYRARCQGRLTGADAEAFAAGLTLSDFTALPARLNILEAGEAESLADVTLTEGKFHQVKRMFAAVGNEVTALHRCAFGPLELDPELREGEWRELTEEEVRLLREAAGMFSLSGE